MVPGEVEDHDQWHWERPYVRYADLIAGGGGLAAMAEAGSDLWSAVVSAVPDGSGALLISHGGSIEPTLVRCLPEADHASWGDPSAHCDGARIDFTQGECANLRFRRAPTLTAEFPTTANHAQRPQMH